MNTLTNIDNDIDFIGLFLSDKATTTKISYSGTLKSFMAFVGKPLREMKLEDVTLWLNRLKLTYKPATIANKTLVIKSLFSFGLKTGYLTANPMMLVKTPKHKENLANRILDQGEVKRLIGAATNDRDRAILSLMYGCGLRVSEVIGLTGDDLKGDKLTVYGKGNKTRTVIVPVAILSMLPGGGGYLFQSKLNKPLSRQSVFKMVKTCADRAGLGDRISPHFLRHSHASHSLKNGANVRLVQATLGHSSITTTEKYLHISPNESSSLFINF
ncbi:MAG: Tyrosine recombinase XerC [Chroococcopsis gigantea SAG 12.99]|jgi:integrase/recombinase XerD|nr:Tyrosine recombinase XerC [Chroococcopsis gigantea SAG 12.99]